jgi:hypothetical protein
MLIVGSYIITSFSSFIYNWKNYNDLYDSCKILQIICTVLICFVIPIIIYFVNKNRIITN